MFKPTKSELLKRGFKESYWAWDPYFAKSFDWFTIKYYKEGKEFYCEAEIDSLEFYPTSWEDIDAIIRIFTPKD